MGQSPPRTIDGHRHYLFQVKIGNRFPVLSLVRAANCAVAGATSLAGSWAVGADLRQDKPWLLSLSAMLIGAFGNAYNDICDLPADRVNRPDRVLVTGEIDMTLALRIAGWCLALGLMLAAYAFVNALIARACLMIPPM